MSGTTRKGDFITVKKLVEVIGEPYQCGSELRVDVLVWDALDLGDEKVERLEWTAYWDDSQGWVLCNP